MDGSALVSVSRLILLLVCAGLFVAVLGRIEDQKTVMMYVMLILGLILLVALGAA